MAPSTFPDGQVSRSTSGLLQSRAIGCQGMGLLCNASAPHEQPLPAVPTNTITPSEATAPLSSAIQGEVSSDKSLTRPLLDDSRRSAICGPPGFAWSVGGSNPRPEGSRPVSLESISTLQSQSSQSSRLQWMWADGVAMSMWSLPRVPDRVAAELERRREIRPVQVRRRGDRKSRTFPSARDAAQWIRSDEGFQSGFGLRRDSSCRTDDSSLSGQVRRL